jgi:hypothetical protein
MMQKNIKLNSYVGKDGMLHLDIPVDVRETELEVTVTLKPIGSKILTEEEIKNLEWHDFIEMTYGCLADDPIIRYPQGEYDVRENIE